MNAPGSIPTLERADCRYQPYYCEENVWHLSRHPALAALRRAALFVTNTAGACALWAQRAAAAPGHPVVWDYHVVLVTLSPGPSLVWDLDSELVFPLPAHLWLDVTFGPLDQLSPDDRDLLAPRFRLVEHADFIRHFASDRRHMRGDDGWQQDPPPWPPITAETGEHHTLDRFLDLDDDALGELHELDSLRARLATSEASSDAE